MKYRNVLHFADYGSPYKGNFITSLETLEKELLKENHTMFYLFPKRTSQREWATKKKNTNFLTGRFIKDRKIVQSIIDDNNIDIIHIHFFSFKTLLLFRTLNRKGKIIVHLHGMFPNYKGIKKYLLKILLKNINIVGCSEAVTKSFPFKNSVNTINSIRNAIYFPRLDEYEEIQEFKGSTEKILIFGYNYYIKGVDIALEGIRKAREKMENIECYVSISSNKRTFEKNVIKKYGFFPDWIKILPPRNDIATYYKNSDIFISASREEGFCYAIVEAAYTGCNIIASKIPAQEELNIDNIFWFKSEDTDELKDKILECINQKESSKEKMIAQKEKIRKEYDINNWTKSILKEYNEIS